MVEAIFFNPWIWIIPTLLVGMVIATAWGVWFRMKQGEFDGTTGSITALLCGVVAFVLAGAYFGALLPPYDTDFYKTYRVTGELSSVEPAFSGDEGTMSQVFVAEVAGVDHLIKSEDQRFRTLEVGDDVNLVCSLQFRYFQEPWYDCAFGGQN